MSHQAATVAVGHVAHKTTALSAIVVAAFGLALILGIGFAQPETIHNAAHDSRHAFSFPCH